MVSGLVVRLIPVTVAKPWESTTTDPLCASVAVQVTVDPGTGLKSCAFLGVIATVAVGAALRRWLACPKI